MDIAITLPVADTWGMHGDDIGTGWMVVMMVAMVLFWGAVIVGIVWLVRGASQGWRAAPSERHTEAPTEILERRFAEGAISADDYHARREVLAGSREPPRTE